VSSAELIFLSATARAASRSVSYGSIVGGG
jgi:hypothetical protein